MTKEEARKADLAIARSLRGNIAGTGVSKTMELWVDPPDDVAVLADKRRAR